MGKEQDLGMLKISSLFCKWIRLDFSLLEISILPNEKKLMIDRELNFYFLKLTLKSKELMLIYVKKGLPTGRWTPGYVRNLGKPLVIFPGLTYFVPETRLCIYS